MNEDIVISIAAFMTSILLLGTILKYRLMSRRMDAEAKQPKLPSDLMTRLERMEQSLDAVAVEVERISEGQRFTTKLLSEKSADAVNRLAVRSGTGSPQDSP